MNFFQNINSLADLKKQYRALAIQHHPDKGGDTETMQKINAAFEELFKIWEHDKSASATATGYENDFAGASAKDYTEYVRHEYRWQGCNYKGQGPPEVVEIIRRWLKEVYPYYKFSVTRRSYDVISVFLLKADFEPFKQDSKYKKYKELNHYHIDKETDLTDRALEVMKNILSYANSFNYDDSDCMTDYFHVNFYLHIGIGTGSNPYKLEKPTLKAKKGDMPLLFKHPEGKVHKAIRQALGKAKFAMYNSRGFGQIMALGEFYYCEDGTEHFYPLSYSSWKTAQKRMDKLTAAGIRCKLSGRNSGFIIFEGYSDETEALLERERQEYTAAKRAWDRKNKKEEASEAEGAERLSFHV